LLGLNPGYSATDPKWHSREDFRRALLLNLKHELKGYPFYPLDPAFQESGAGQWWHKRIRWLQSESKLDPRTFAERIMVIEWFPYHSVSFEAPRTKLPSQEYSFQLARSVVGSKVVVGMRSRQRWEKVDLRLGKINYLSNPRCGHVSRGNMDGSSFSEILTVLRA
jgi:hypothetical protein